jgi:YD repeat-containing protein
MKKFTSLLILFVSLTSISQNQNVNYEYDLLGRLKCINYTDNKKVKYTYDLVSNRLQSISGDLFYLDIKVFLQGSFNGSIMNSYPNQENIPSQNPFTEYPWFYNGIESVNASQNSNIVDWVLVELRQTSGDATTALPDSVIAQQAGFLLKDGKVICLDGLNLLQFNVQVTQNLYLVIRHKNHLGIMSSIPLVLQNNTYTYDFTTSSTKYHGGSAGCIELRAGVWGMIAGDVDANGIVDAYDKEKWDTQAGKSDYNIADVNLDDDVDNLDKNDFWINTLGFYSQIPGDSIPNIGNVPTGGLTAFYPFNGNANDESLNGWNGNIIGAVLTNDRFGKVDSAFYFNPGIPCKIVTQFPGIMGSRSRTISFWQTSENTQGVSMSYGAGTSYPTTPGCTFLMAAGKNINNQTTIVGIDLRYGGIAYVTPDTTSSWHHYIIIVPDKPSPATQDIIVYRDGIKMTTLYQNWGNVLINTLSGLNFTIGQFVNSANFSGKLDDIRIYNRALNESEINALYHEGGW